ncbi:MULTISPECIES: glycoside hydrolase family 3 C-terminal domain-containing protein [unclassified Clostridium]|uniref:glycoside hydrolase family 3 C-terminal domain-containing protein n=1 Tax=unclassified Clostridium TaxID=2614128 RepID=UPI000298591D|nr:MULTISPECIES: glycoside hydrolase family 3 C-terminal domain-containing protein [unclassified Clostridium]EKQ51693.1 MAG: beta-glucosidase-like glycosyl hydrolase [Clostridium sp. Maddingley MBC34-26]
MDIRNIINQLTLEEKASMCSCKNIWETQDIERLGIPSLTLAYGSNGLVKRSATLSDIIPSTCFPTPSALSSSWDVDLAYAVGKAIAEECVAENVNLLLGPSMNIQRSPLSGRNFQYFSEDPVLSGEISASFIQGLQSEGVGACIKDYAGNNQEYHRQNINNIIGDQPLNEIYLYNFEIAVKKGHPFAVMAAHNNINGMPCAENKLLLTDLLRNQWNFDGLVLSNWYGVDSIIDSLMAGLNLELPDSYINSKSIVDAVLNGALDPAVLNKAVEDIINIVFRIAHNQNSYDTYDKEKHHDLAREAAENCMVLLKNRHNILPLKRERLKNKRIAIIGEYAKNPRYQGTGTSSVVPTILENPYNEITKLVGNSIKINYAKGYNTSSDDTGEDDNTLHREAKRVAKESDVVIIFAGTPDSYDAENEDNKDANLPENQIKLIKEISKIHKNVILVLNNGSPLTTSSWSKYPDAILEAWLAGQANGSAIANILFGIVTPSGKLSSTFPMKLSDTPTYLDNVSPENHLEYREGIFVGYRYYDKKEIPVEFPFGFGLSYTTFNYSDLTLSKDVVRDTDIVEVKLKVKNTGKYFGKEVVELYVRNIISSTPRPEKELKAFTKIPLFPGEEKEVTFYLSTRDFSYYDRATNSWVVESGPYEILIGKSSRDIALSKNIYIQSAYVPVPKYAENTLIGEFLTNPNARAVIEPILQNIAELITGDKETQEEIINYLKYIPINKLSVISNGDFTNDMLDNILKSVNAS